MQRDSIEKSTKEKEKKLPTDTNWGINLPKALMSTVLFGYHTPDEAKNFAEVSDDAKAAYKDALLAVDFVEHVAKGEQDLAEQMLKEANSALKFSLLSQKVSVKDYSSRTFFNITALQYAVWALDRHMWTMLKKYMPDKEIQKQLADMESTGGIEYQLPAKSEIRREMHYDFNELISALQNYTKSYDYLEMMPEYSYDDVVAAFKLLGRAQSHVPAHVVNEYCHPYRSFATIPDFKNDMSLPRTVKIAFPKYGWFHEVTGKKLGDFVIIRGNYLYGSGIVWAAGEDEILHGRLDLAAMENLHKTRTLELRELKDSLLLDEERPCLPNNKR